MENVSKSFMQLMVVVRRFCNKQNNICSFTLTELLFKLDLMLRLNNTMEVLDYFS